MFNTEEYNKYICPTKGCSLIPEIINVHSDLGLIVLKCFKGHINEISVENYFKKLNKKKEINPEGNNIDNEEEISEAKALDFRKVLSNKIDQISDMIFFYKKILDIQEEHSENHICNKNIINLSDFIEKEKEAKVPKDNNINETITIDDIIKEIENKRKKEDEIIKSN